MDNSVIFNVSLKCLIFREKSTLIISDIHHNYKLFGHSCAVQATRKDKRRSNLDNFKYIK